MTDFPLVTKCDHYKSVAEDILFLNMSLVSSMCLFEVWIFNKGAIDDKRAMITMCWIIIRKNVRTSSAQQSCITLLNLCSRFIAHVPIRVFEECTSQNEQTGHK